MRPKDTSSSSRHKNKELRRLEAYNKSRSGRSRTDENHHEIEEEVKDERHDGKDERGDPSSSQRQSMLQSRSRSPSVPSEWAKELLRQQQENAKYSIFRQKTNTDKSKLPKSKYSVCQNQSFATWETENNTNLTRVWWEKSPRRWKQRSRVQQRSSLNEGKKLLLEKQADFAR